MRSSNDFHPAYLPSAFASYLARAWTIDEEVGAVMTDEPIIYRCPHEKEVGKTSICYPAHRCDLNEGHDGSHKCDCGKTFKRSSNFGDADDD